MTFCRSILLLALAASPALAQGLAPPPPPKQSDLKPNERMVSLSSGPHIFESLVVIGPDGKVVRLDGQLDLAALQRNPLITEQNRERIRGAIVNWNADIERVVIDNVDFLDMIEPAGGGPGMIDTLDSNSNDQMRNIAQVTAQLTSAGNLSNTLNGQGLLTPDQFALNQHIVADYLQRCMGEVTPPGEQIQTPEQSLSRTNRYNRFLYGVQATDAVATWHRMLAQAAPNLGKAIETLKLDASTTAKLQPAIAEAKSASTDAARRTAVRTALSQLSFAQRQEALRAARDMGPRFDPFATIANAPTPAAAANTAPDAAAAKNGG